MSKKFYWVVQAEVLEDKTVKWDHADGYFWEYDMGFPNGSMLVIDDENPFSGHFEIITESEDVDKDDLTFNDLRTKLSF